MILLQCSWLSRIIMQQLIQMQSTCNDTCLLREIERDDLKYSEIGRPIWIMLEGYTEPSHLLFVGESSDYKAKLNRWRVFMWDCMFIVSCHPNWGQLMMLKYLGRGSIAGVPWKLIFFFSNFSFTRIGNKTDTRMFSDIKRVQMQM